MSQTTLQMIAGCTGEPVKAHMSPQSQQLDDHLDSEHHREDHVEDVHDRREQFGLLIMLMDDTQKTTTKKTVRTTAVRPASLNGTTPVCIQIRLRQDLG